MRMASMTGLFRVFGLAALLATAAGAAEASEDEDALHEEPVVLGYLENVSVGKLGLEMKAKLDTGADTSSVHARNVEIYKRGKRDNWVKFRLVGKDGRSIRYDQNVIRFAQRIAATVRSNVPRGY